MRITLLSLLLTGITLMTLLAYGSPLPSQKTLHDDQAMSPANDPSALVISENTSTVQSHSILPAENPTSYADPDMLSPHEQENISGFTQSDIDSGVRAKVFRG